MNIQQLAQHARSLCLFVSPFSLFQVWYGLQPTFFKMFLNFDVKTAMWWYLTLLPLSCAFTVSFQWRRHPHFLIHIQNIGYPPHIPRLFLIYCSSNTFQKSIVAMVMERKREAGSVPFSQYQGFTAAQVWELSVRQVDFESPLSSRSLLVVNLYLRRKNTSTLQVSSTSVVCRTN